MSKFLDELRKALADARTKNAPERHIKRLEKMIQEEEAENDAGFSDL